MARGSYVRDNQPSWLDCALGSEVPVPVNWAYNHHYGAWIQGKHSQMVLVKASPHEHEYWARADGTKWQSASVPEDPTPDSPIPTSQFFSEGNGGEWRKSFHGYPRGYAQLVEQPQRFQIAPMQIDTYNRDNNGTRFVPGPMPKASLAPADAAYSGLLECPCTDRLYKVINSTYSTRVEAVCAAGEAVWNATECFGAAQKLAGGAVKLGMRTVNDTSLPIGCSFTPTTALFNTAESSSATCGAQAGVGAVGTVTDNTTGVTVALSVDRSALVVQISLSGPADVWFGVGFGAKVMATLPYAISVSADSTGVAAVVEHKLGDHDPGSILASSVTVLSSQLHDGIRTVVLSRNLAGLTASHYTFDLSQDGTIPLITAAGSTSTFGYHKLRASSQISLRNGANASTCVCAKGVSGELCGHAVGGCVGFDVANQGQSITGDRCPANSSFSQLAAFRNPTCTIQGYSGGLQCCHHLNILLDRDQNPWPTALLTYRLKFRFWFQPYAPADPAKNQAASHQNLVRLYWQTEAFAGAHLPMFWPRVAGCVWASKVWSQLYASGLCRAGEYDVPKGSLMLPGTTIEADGSYVYTIQSSWPVQDMVSTHSLVRPLTQG